jgi:hypothetical protein
MDCVCHDINNRPTFLERVQAMSLKIIKLFIRNTVRRQPNHFILCQFIHDILPALKFDVIFKSELDNEKKGGEKDKSSGHEYTRQRVIISNDALLH